MISFAGLMLALLFQVPTTAPAGTGEWKLNGSDREFLMEASGRAADPKGAVLSLRSTSTSVRSTGSLSATLPANAFRGRRMTLTAELLASSRKGVGLLIRADAGPTVAVTLENSLAGAVRLEDGWRAGSVSIPVPNNATVLAIGIILQGEGSVSARAVRLTTGEPFAALPISKPAQKVLEEAISLVKENTPRRDEIDWAMVEPQVRALAGGARKTSEAYPAIQWLLTQTGDRRSYFVTATGAKDFWAAETLTVPMVRSLSDGVGYLKVSGSSGGDPDQTRAYASGLYARLATTAGAARCGFVIDLRENTGGNTWPLVAGLRPLLGGEPDGRPDPPPGSGSPWVATIAPREAPESLKGLEFVRVAVLIGPGTVSSAVTNAFRRRLQTRSFGQPTTGVPSANSLLPLSDGAMILLTTATIADPTGKRYGARVEPDEVISAPVRPERDGDPTLSAAVGWLKQSRTCGASR